LKQRLSGAVEKLQALQFAPSFGANPFYKEADTLSKLEA